MSVESLSLIPFADADPERLLPQPQGLVGEAMVRRLSEIIDSNHTLDGTQKQAVYDRLAVLIDAVGFNEPVMRLSPGGNIQIIGYANTELSLIPDPLDYNHTGEMALSCGIAYEGYRCWESWHVDYPLKDLTKHVINNEMHFLVGASEIQNWLEQRGPHALITENATSQHIIKDIAILDRLCAAHFPVEYLGLTYEERQRLLDAYLEWQYSHTLISQNYALIDYIAGVTCDEHRKVFHRTLVDHFAQKLPTSPSDQEQEGLLLVIMPLADQLGSIEGLPNNEHIRKRTRRAGLMAMMYGQRAAQLAAAKLTDSVSLPSERQPFFGPWPEHNLAIYGNSRPTVEDKWRVVDHLNYLRSHGIPVDHLQRTEVRVRNLEHCLNTLLVEHAAPQDMHQIYDALEYLFEVADDNCTYHYDMIGRTLATLVPTSEFEHRTINRLVTIASVFAARQPPTDAQGHFLYGEAATTATLAKWYKRAMLACYQADISRAGDVGARVLNPDLFDEAPNNLRL